MTVSPHVVKGLGGCDGAGIEDGTLVLPYPGPQCPHKHPAKRGTGGSESGRRRGGWEWGVVGEGPTSGGLWAAGSRTGWERILPCSLQRSQPRPHLGFSPGRPGGASDHQNCKMINTFVLFRAPALVVTCSSSHRKPPRCFVSLHFPAAKHPALLSCQQGAVVRGDEWTDVHGEVSWGPWGQQLPSRGLRGCRPVQLGSGAGRVAGEHWLSLPDEFGVLGVEVLQTSRSR